jgi:hypothetical protein
MPVDIEVLVTKISGYFHIHTVRVERINDFCDSAGQEYKQILDYANVRWLSLLPTLETTLKICPSLMSFFLCQKHSAQKYCNNSWKTDKAVANGKCTRRDEHFIPQMAKKLLTDVVQGGEITMKIKFQNMKRIL